ncbi:arginine--tRNA ligase [Candidatus Uhrbacteria bacterium RIFCSPHIGHO2_02_FULL_47_29]|uniref:Arginine--tRNA ligase n=1 Tax=Candidatus Uhrbacteria bacterium RIFCSPLOWO2_01_FULL_47_25 TaxID=1802402 RepID=A0A1F7USH6_9BACT|nr:MAG: Arginine-tRNA ligase [Parcubacteria group bacterium GW2011_GWA2_46_9]OGL60856.1 MAG: arginine--tRNA ligase [Candidatus Uhrbacteria bacterium RIFCSPHIGHO2_01_FULL_46_23]OGL68242.1 MAG: arginine--tRNA ligase [Candidatus Uhrbacteria bacterium RIFCSPHIGHO2_02_FULL_47_29]OGL81250.1 MAG: arginine--tRNA ligase [Candidatus Uhrbacteria bacterium RIFCSPLOWO2_01_FULL_47_25]OGL86027.1 MAG: arginine--tRNA ligase [Candidatus Uhrbacteria bacterium RIFCSPLOWO2_02_FULL_46_19]
MTNPHAESIQEIVRAFKEGTKLEIAPTDIVMSEHNHGDFAVACFKFARNSGRAAEAVAEATAIAINEWLEHNANSLLQKLTIAGPYINITLNQKKFTELAMKAVTDAGSVYGCSNFGQGKRVVLEYVSPNTNKPLHLGHLRNAALGWSVAKLLEASGYEVIKTSIVNDRGIHIMKSMLAYQKWSELWTDKKLTHETPSRAKMKGDALVGKYYVLYKIKADENPALEEESRELLRKWEAHDQETRTLWKKMNDWATKGHEETLKRFGVSFDKLYFESDIYEEGRAIVEAEAAAGKAQKNSDGAISIDLTPEGLGPKILLRADGTSVYITQDLALARHRINDFHPTKIVYVVAQEQDYQFRALFAVLKRFGIAQDIELKHLSYHWVFLPEGRMKSREGKVVEADDLLDELSELALKEIKTRHAKISQTVAKKRAEIIALAAAKYYLLKSRLDSDINFDPKQSIALTGRTGPYLLYTYARVSSIFNKAKEEKIELGTEMTLPVNVSLLEWQIIKLAAKLPAVIEEAAAAYDPSIIADFGYNLAKTINDFYEAEPVLKAEPNVRAWRLELLQAAQLVLKRSLELMGIEGLEEM